MIADSVSAAIAAAPHSQELLALIARQGLLRSYVRQCILSSLLQQEQLSEDERRQAFSSFSQKYKLANQRALEQFCASNFLDSETLAFKIELPIRLSRHVKRFFESNAEARFLNRKQHLDRVVYSLIRTRDPGLARELYLQIVDGEAAFSDLAIQHGEGSERQSHGIVGPVPIAQAHPQLVERLVTASLGEVQEPFKIEKWWLIVRVESLIPASFDESMALQMSNELFDEWVEGQVESCLEQLRPHLSIQFATDYQ